MRQQLRLRVLLPVAVLGLLGVGYGAFAYGQGPEVPESIPPPAATTETTPAPKAKPKPKPKPKPNAKPKPAPPREVSELARELEENGVAVVVFYTPHNDLDSSAVREARAGAEAADAGFVAVNVKKEKAVRRLAARLVVLRAPAVVVLVPGRVTAKFLGYVDRVTVEQAVENARP